MTQSLKLKVLNKKEFKQYFPNDGWVEHDAQKKYGEM